MFASMLKTLPPAAKHSLTPKYLATSLLDTPTRQPSNAQQAAIAKSFSKAATSYDQAASLQREVGLELLQLLPKPIQVQRWLDLGSGTGFFAGQLGRKYPQAQGWALDLSPQMLAVSRHKYPQVEHLCADAAAPPLATASLDLIFSNFALQWCPDLLAVLQQAKRLLKPGGLLVFSSVLQGSMQELSHSWQQVDGRSHINNFRDLNAYQQAISASGWQVQQLLTTTKVQYQPKVADILRSLKLLGANHLHQGRSPGLLARGSYQRLQQAYAAYQQPQGLPLSWHLLLTALIKPGA